MLEDYARYLASVCKKFAKGNDVFDIVLYGSIVKGKEDAEDIDLLLIFKEKKLNERVEISQRLKEILRKKIPNIDIKSINLVELFEKEFLARQGMLVEGLSLLHDMKISKRLGFESYALFTYKLTNLNHNEKTKFTYALIGRTSKGMIKQLTAKPLGKGAIIVPTDKSIIFENFLQRWNINYKKNNILMM